MYMMQDTNKKHAPAAAPGKAKQKSLTSFFSSK
jgi:hypothetical protein